MNTSRFVRALRRVAVPAVAVPVFSWCVVGLWMACAQAQDVTTTTTTTGPPIRQRFSTPSGRDIVGQLTAARARRPIPVKRNLTAKQRAQEARRIAAMTPAQRKKMVFKKYDIAPVGWLSSYLPADRYKFGKVWQYVSTETDRHYYRPQDMARKKFNANRVIGFRTWQLAMQAGYSPDPVSKPAPGAQIAALARYTRGPNFYRFVEFTYTGQVSPTSFEQTYDYARRVTDALNSSPNGRRYLSNTLDRVFQATVESDPSLIPRTVGGPPPAPPTTTNADSGGRGSDTGGGSGSSSGMSGSDMRGQDSAPNFPSANNVGSPTSGNGGG